MKKILFPTDFSERSLEAYEYALRLADKLSCSITTLHIFNLPNVEIANLPNTVEEIYQDMEEEEFQTYRESIPPLDKVAQDNNLSHINVNHILLKSENLEKSIIDMSKEENADIIVMSSKGAKGMRSILSGSKTAEIMENAPCPVLSVPVKNLAYDSKIDKIAYLFKGDFDDMEGLDYIIQLSKKLKAELYCLYVDLAQSENLIHRLDSVRRKFSNESHVQIELREGVYYEEVIQKYVEERKIDVMSILIHKRNFWQELFSTSRTKQLQHQSTYPILAIPENLAK